VRTPYDYVMNPTKAPRPKVLFVAPELPHAPLTGAHTRPLSIVRALAIGCEVTVVGAAPAGANLTALGATGARVISLDQAPYARSVPRALLARARRLASPVPLVSRGYSPVMGRLVLETVSEMQPDVLHLVSMYSCWYRDERLPAVVDLLDVVSGLCDSAAAAHPVRYALANLQQRTSESLERRELAKMSAVLAINVSDAARLGRLGVSATVVPLAVAVPTEAELTGSAGTAARAAAPSCEDAGRAGGPRPLSLLFVGSFLHHPNRASAAFLVRELAPELRRRRISFTLTIAGRDAAAVEARVRDGSVRYVSDPPDLAELYRGADVVLAPIVFGGGTKNKTLEAMAWSKPVLGSPSAFTGISARDGVAFVSAPLNGAAMADALARLSGDPLLRAALGGAAREYVCANHSQSVVDERVASVYARVLAGRA
jgi:polysaccharide biosynthesis protein PslH